MRSSGDWQPPGRTRYASRRPWGQPGPRWHRLVAAGIIPEGTAWRGQHASYEVRLDGKLKIWSWHTIRCHRWKGVDEPTGI